MSAGGFQQTPQSLTSPASTPTSNASTSSALSATPASQLDEQTIKEEVSSPPPPSSQAYVMIPPQTQGSVANLSHSILDSSDYPNTTFHFPYGNSRQQNLFLLTADSSFTSLASHAAFDIKDGNKIDSTNVVFSSRSLNSSLQGQNASPKSFVTLHVTESKNDKMISGFDGRVDGLSPLSVIAVSAYQDGHTSPNISNSGLTRSQQVLRHHPGSDAMLSAINYSENDTLQSVFDVPVSSTFSTLDGLLGSGIGGGTTPVMRLPDLLDGEVSQEPYMETGQDIQLSPQTFSTGADTFGVDGASLSGISDTTVDTADDVNKLPELTGASLLPEKLRTKGRPVKATSPSRPGTQPCPTCGKVFSNSSALTKHKLTHSDERKYVCQLCAKAFKRQDHLNGHMLTHRNKKPFECDVEGCGKSYCDARSLRRHKENHHSNSASTTTAITVPSVGSHVAVIPGLAHLGFNSVQPSFPASVIANSNSSVFSESVGNRIQYAPPGTSAQTLQPSFNQNTVQGTVGNPLVSSVVPTATSQLQFLAFQQQPTSTHPKTHLQAPTSSSSTTTSTSSSVSGRTDGSSVLTPWQPQTINTDALLLTQNFGSSGTQSSLCQSRTSQIKIEALESAEHQIKKSHIEISQKPQDQCHQEHLQKHQTQASHEHSLQKSPDSYINSPLACPPSESAIKQTVLSSTQTINVLAASTTSLSDAVYSQSTLNQPVIEGEISNASETSIDNSGVPSIPQNSTVNESDRPKISSPLLQQLLSPPQPVDALGQSRAEEQTHSQHNFMQPPAQATQQVVIPPWTQVSYCLPNTSGTTNIRASQDPKPVECSLCQRKFKNIPALNGHMRLHGGYFKKENDLKKADRKNNSTSHHPPLQTASTNVRALIEEKIIQRRNFAPQTLQTTVDPSTAVVRTTCQYQPPEPSIQTNQEVHTSQFTSQPQPPVLSPTAQDTSVFAEFPVTSQSCLPYDTLSNTTPSNVVPFDWSKELINELKQQFRVPHPPVEKLRRHSDSDHFIPPKRPCTSYTSSALADLLRKKVVAKRTSRTGSDPGEPLHINSHSISTPTTPINNLPPELINPSTLSSDHSLSIHHIHQDDAFEPISSEKYILPILLAEDIPDSQLGEGLRDFSDIQPVGMVDAQASDNLVKSELFISSLTDSAAEQSCSQFSVSDIEIMQMANSLSSSAAIQSSAIGNVNILKTRTGDDSNDDDVFLSPSSLPTSPMKIKRKHRPEPLYIPPYVNTSGFTSRLRSPRLWDPCNPDNKHISPPPYTPPPMLSPVRSGSGLFWHILSSSGSLTPKSAPITPNFGLFRKASTSEILPEEEEPSEAPETDILPHVNIGSHYQARLPSFNSNQQDALLSEHKADLIWDPKTLNNISDEEVDMYMELACCATVPGGGRNKEYALHLLEVCEGNLQEAILKLMDPQPYLSLGHPLHSYQYSESERWTREEIEIYHQALIRCDKDFFSISKEIQTKTVKQCIQFYYLWKKVCPEEYKRLRLVRRRREQESIIYNLRSKPPSESSEEKGDGQHLLSGENDHSLDINNLPLAYHNGQSPSQNGLEAITRSSSCGSSTGSMSAVAFNGSTIPTVTSAYEFPIEPVEEFPCKICGKVFSKVKSRSAHMKSHRPSENDKKNKYEC